MGTVYISLSNISYEVGLGEKNLSNKSKSAFTEHLLFAWHDDLKSIFSHKHIGVLADNLLNVLLYKYRQLYILVLQNFLKCNREIKNV